MSPILVPTLSELGVELGKAMGAEHVVFARWHALHNAGADTSPFEDDCQAAYDAVSAITEQIAALPVASLADLRVKAMAMDWHNRTIEAPADFWTLLGAQIVAGLLDSRIGQ